MLSKGSLINCSGNCDLLLTGISRASLPSGTKGFGGTEGFMAPEMMRFNGEEEYTEKVGGGEGGRVGSK